MLFFFSSVLFSVFILGDVFSVIFRAVVFDVKDDGYSLCCHVRAKGNGCACACACA